MFRFIIPLLFTAAVAAANSVTLYDFMKEHRPIPCWQGKKLEQSATCSDDGLHVRWNTYKSRVCIFGEPFKREIPLNEFGSAFCTFELENEVPSIVNELCIRFIDSKNEVFQWRVAADLRKKGLHRITIPMTQKNFQVSFRGNNDKKIDFPMYLYSCLGVAPKDCGEASILVRKITYEANPVNSVLDSVKFELETGTVSRVLKPGEENNLAFLLCNPSKTALPCRMKIEFRDFFDNTLTEDATLSLPAGGTLRYIPKIRLPFFGHWTVHLRLETMDGSAFAERKRSFAYMTPAGPGTLRKEGFIFGICIPGWYDTKIFPLEAETAALCGASALRLNFRWRELEQSPGVWKTAKLDTLLGEYEKRGIELMPILSNPPVWARAEKNVPISLPDHDKWRKYIRYFFRNYGDRIRYWEVWNEPDTFSFCGFNASEYVELQRIVREEQKKFAPQTKLLTGGFAHALPQYNKKGFQEYVLANGKQYFDVHAFHGHGEFKLFRRQVEELLYPMRLQTGTRSPWYANETAISSYGIGEKRQAETLFKKFLYAWSAGSIGYNWYNLRNNGYAANAEHHYGLVTNDFYPKPAYVVYNTLATVYREMEFVRRHSKKNDIWILEFAGKGNRAVAIWNASPEKAADEIVSFKSDASAVEIIDLMGNRRPLAQHSGTVIRKISETPEILMFRNSSPLSGAASVVKAQIKNPAVPGFPADLELMLFNPFKEKMVFQLSLNCGKGIFVKLPEHITLNPEEHRKLKTQVFVTKEKPRQHNSLNLQVTTPYHISQLRIPLKQAFLIPANRKVDDWDFLLSHREQVVPLFDADPGNQHRLWSGPQDLSAKIGMSAERGIWTIRFVVTDDKHVQPYKGFDVWKGDNIQIAFQIPGQKSLWTAGLTLLADGKPELYLWDVPEVFASKAPLKQWKLNVRRSGTQTEYEVKIPFSSIGASPRHLKQGIRFSALINDNDGYGREGWIQISEGIAGNRSSDPYPLLIFEME